MPNGIALAIAAYPALAISSGITSRWSRALSLVLALASLALPFLVPREHTGIRVLLAFGTGLILLRAIDLARDPRTWPLVDRVWLMFAMFERPRTREDPSRNPLARFRWVRRVRGTVGAGSGARDLGCTRHRRVRRPRAALARRRARNLLRSRCFQLPPHRPACPRRASRPCATPLPRAVTLGP